VGVKYKLVVRDGLVIEIGLACNHKVLSKKVIRIGTTSNFFLKNNCTKVGIVVSKLWVCKCLSSQRSVMVDDEDWKLEQHRTFFLKKIKGDSCCC
jgi:hypothetical protein